MDEIQQNIFRKALDYRNSMITKVDTWDEFVDVLENKGGFISAHWDGTVETEVAIKDATKATIRRDPDGCGRGGGQMRIQRQTVASPRTFRPQLLNAVDTELSQRRRMPFREVSVFVFAGNRS